MDKNDNHNIGDSAENYVQKNWYSFFETDPTFEMKTTDEYFSGIDIENCFDSSSLPLLESLKNSLNRGDLKEQDNEKLKNQTNYLFLIDTPTNDELDGGLENVRNHELGTRLISSDLVYSFFGKEGPQYSNNSTPVPLLDYYNCPKRESEVKKFSNFISADIIEKAWIKNSDSWIRVSFLKNGKSSRNDFKNRRDTINKSCLRCIRRCLKQKFYSSSHLLRHTTKYRLAINFYDTIKEFWVDYLSITKEIDESENALEVEQVIGFLINPSLYKKGIKRNKLKIIGNSEKIGYLVKECWYKYSHEKFEFLLSNRLFRKLFKILHKTMKVDWEKIEEDTLRLTNQTRVFEQIKLLVDN